MHSYLETLLMFIKQVRKFLGTELIVVVCGQHVPLTSNCVTFVCGEP